jgi:hypothetical protein
MKMPALNTVGVGNFRVYGSPPTPKAFEYRSADI